MSFIYLNESKWLKMMISIFVFFAFFIGNVESTYDLCMFDSNVTFGNRQLLTNSIVDSSFSPTTSKLWWIDSSKRISSIQLNSNGNTGIFLIEIIINCLNSLNFKRYPYNIWNSKIILLFYYFIY